ncbi:MAG TPA: Asp-tRNA(Asn)/Glu-tRNA(Gln) amidotransferase subunit GatA [Patescibacteria group bacterium]|nr:Asp-tRNA(Asn)/Glu-tRNA(Gln) amidotransferase subunit GatA [Patescibacteria group bacterium]
MIPSVSIKDNLNNLKSGNYKAVNLVDYFLDRINKFDNNINSFITITENAAYEKARWIDKLISEGTKDPEKEYPLLGTVIAFKDLFLTKGVRTTAASKVLDNYIPAYNATVVERLEKAGCITIGKLNCDAWAHGSSGENSDFGSTKNPWNFDYTPGGSSSGSGASLAAQFCQVTTGTDTCGSIRLPANYCYKVGFKPTYGSVSRYGIVAMASSLDSIGHLTNTVEDARRVFNVTKGPDGYDSTLKTSDYIFDKNKKLRIGIPKEFFVKGIDKSVEDNIKKAILIFKDLGVETVEISLPHTKYGLSVYYIIQPAEVSSNLGRYDGIRYGNSRDSFGSEAKRRIILGSFVLSSGYYDAYYLKAMKVRTIIKSEVDDVLKKVDAIIAPVAPTPPFKLGEKINDPLKMYLTDIYAATANLAGIPSLAIPFGFSKESLPLGFQLMGPRFSEEMLFNLGEKFEKESGYEPKFASLK